jgi:uncharacterized protein YneF (UPF0154 family)
MSSDAALILGIVMLLWLGGMIGWWLSCKFYESRYKELLDASIEVNKVTISSLAKSMKEIKAKKEND